MKRELSTGATVGLAVTAGIVIASLIGGVGTGIQLASRPPSPPYNGYGPTVPNQTPGDYSDLAQGEPGSPAAVTPLECIGACFGQASAEEAILPDAMFEDWGLPFTRPVWDSGSDRTTAIDVQVSAHQSWDATGFTPDDCFVTWSEVPFVESADAVVGADLIAPLTEHSSNEYPGTSLRQSVRLFSDTASAAGYMATLSAGIAACTRYHDPNGYPIDVVTPEPGLHPPDSVAAVGFAQSPQAGTRYYVMDLQRGNMVIRSVAVSDGGIEDQFFRTLMMKQAQAIGELEPIG